MRHRLLPLAAALWAAACGKSGSSGKTQSAAGDVAATQAAVLAPQDVAQATRGSISPTVVISGSLDPYKTVDVKAQVGGTITSLRADRGQAVARGELLAVIQAQGIQSQAAGARAQVSAAEAQVALAQRQLESTRKLYQAGASSEIEYRTAQAQYQSAEGQLAAARAQASGANESASHTTIVAPISGVVSARDVDDGEAVSPGAKLLTIVDPDTLELAGEIPVQSAGQVHAGLPVSFRLDAYPGQTFAGRVSRVDPTADPNTRRVGASLYLPNPGRRIIGGQFVTGEVLSGAPAEDAVVVPQAAVRGGGDSSYVFVVEGGKLARRAVALGPRDLTRGVISVLSGVREGETVIVSPSTDLVAGTPVRLPAAGSR